VSKIMTCCTGLALVGALVACAQPAAARTAGSWRWAIEVPGLGELNKGANASSITGVSSVSCAAAGNCAAGGFYTDQAGNGQGFVATERHGRWGKAINVPRLRALNDGTNAEVESVSCSSAGGCAAVGTYGEPYGMGFEAVEKNGVWGKATNLPGLAALDGRLAGAESVSCASPGNCAAGGYYTDRHHHSQGFVVSQAG
jgi:hypothetical protein